MADQAENNEEKEEITKEIVSNATIIPNPIDPVQKLPVRRYLDETIVPILLAGMTQLVKERPLDPIEYLAQFLLKNNPNSPTNVQHHRQSDSENNNQQDSNNDTQNQQK
eukprot:UN01079